MYQGSKKVEKVANPWCFQLCCNLVSNKVVTTRNFNMGNQPHGETASYIAWHIHMMLLINMIALLITL